MKQAVDNLETATLRPGTTELEDATRAHSEFLTNMSQEICVPVDGILGLAELLLSTNLTREQRDYAEAVRRCGHSLLTFVNDIVDFAKVQAGKLQLEALDFDVRTTVQEVIDLLAERSHAKGLEMACLIHHDVPGTLRGDPGRLRQILTNLLANAVRFTERGKVILRARLAEQTGRAVRLHFEFSGMGLSISPEDCVRMFKTSSQLDTSRKSDGTGLGFAISKQIVELMGGQIGIESDANKGTIFWLTTRLEKPEVDLALLTPRENLRALRVLVIDDDESNRKSLLAQTLSWGMVCDGTEEATQAMEMLRSAASRGQPYHLAILDVQMPGLDGLGLARAIKLEPALAAMPLVLMTATALRGHAEASRKAGIAGYLSKPVRQSQLYECLTAVMGASSKPSAAEMAPAPQFVTAHNLKEAKSRSRPRVLVAEDNQVNQMWAVRMLEMLGAQADVAVNGFEAVEAFKRTTYDLILMDCYMPEMDGFAAAQAIRQCEAAVGGGHVPIIALSAGAIPEDGKRCLQAGMDEYISKPVKTAVLRELLKRWTQRSTSADSPPRADASADQSGAIDASVLDGFRQPGSAAPDFLPKLVNQFLSEAQARLERLRDALEHLDAQALKLAAHSLRGSSLSMGAKTMGALCAELEDRGRNGRLDDTAALLAQLEDEFVRVREALDAELRN